MDEDATRYGRLDLGPGNIVLEGDPARLAREGHSSQFSAHLYCGQTAGWMKTPLATEVYLSPGYGDPAPPPLRKGHISPVSFRFMSIVTTVAHLSYC